MQGGEKKSWWKEREKNREDGEKGRKKSVKQKERNDRDDISF